MTMCILLLGNYLKYNIPLSVPFSIPPYVWNKILGHHLKVCLLYTSPSPRDGLLSRMPSSA